VTIPKFKTRNLSTSVIIKDGETVVLGGLIKESNTKVRTKVPVLGDIPLLGSLFRKTTDDTERRNLLIFITARVVNKKEEIMASAKKDAETGQ
jgi:general secretion pathway protein D